MQQKQLSLTSQIDRLQKQVKSQDVPESEQVQQLTFKLSQEKARADLFEQQRANAQYQLKKLQEKYDSLEQQHKALISQCSKQVADVPKLQNQIKQLQGQIDELKIINQLKSDTHGQAMQIQALKLQILQMHKDTYKKTERKDKIIADLQQQISGQNQTLVYQEHQREVDQLKEKIVTQRKLEQAKMCIMNNKVNELQNQIMFSNEDVQKVRQQMTSLRDENAELKKQLLQFRDAQAKMSEQQAQF